MTAVGDIIPVGQPIPDDVTGVRDRASDPHELDAAGRWHQDGIGNDGHPWDADELTEWGPLTVTAVREQPAEPERTLIGPPHAHLDAPCTDACYEPAEPEPQQADVSPVLDLVQQYGEESYQQGIAAGQRDEGAEDHYDDKARALLARIVALVPQQPVQAKCAYGDLLWLSENSAVVHHGQPPSGLWRPLLVGGDPAPEGHEFKPSAVGTPSWRCSVCGSLDLHDSHEPHVDGPREPSAEERADHELMTALGVERIEEVMPAIERLKAAQPDPLVLSLPEVPEGTEALVTEDGDRFAAHGHQGGHSWWHSSRRGTMSLARLLSEAGPVRVELAPPREPRTAVEVWAGLHQDERDSIAISLGFSRLAEALDREAGL